MVRLTTALAILAGASAALASTPTQPSWLLKRGAGVTGCTCCGFSVQVGDGNFQNMVNYPVLLWSYTAKDSNTGWCFEDGALEPEFVKYITDAVVTGESNPYVNATGAKVKCWASGWNTNEECINGIIDQYSDFIVGQNRDYYSGWVHTDCTYPPANFRPTTCYCGWECDEGFVQCGNNCIDPAISVCQSGAPAAKVRRNKIPNCPVGADLCPVPSTKGFECLDIKSSLEACGGCPYSPGSVDCTSIPGAESVSCVDGKCEVHSCASGWILVDGVCDVK